MAVLVALFGGTLFASSALLFLMEPMFAKMALPLLGGSPQVWNTCVVFFQAMLLGAYAYAHVTARLGLRRQSALHIVLVVVALGALPVRIGAGWIPPSEGTPIPWLLALLAVSVGIPFFVLASTAPLLQKWFSTTRHRSAADPYFLYVASNAGSLLGLLAYPLLLEPALRLGAQSVVWSLGYGVFASLTAACACVLLLRHRRDGDGGVLVASEAGPAEHGHPAAPGWSRRLHWLCLALVPSSLMLGVTTYLSTDIAPVPLLWIVPLSVYLATFILAFASRAVLPEGTERLLPAAVLPLAIAMIVQATGPLWFLVSLHLLVFFLASFACHRRLAAGRPGTAHLTEFYLWVAIGGALGGIFNTLVAPNLFNSVAEYPIAIVAACALGLRKSREPRSVKAEVFAPIAVGLVTYLVLIGTRLGTAPVPIAFSGLALPALFTFRIWRRPFSFAAALTLIFLAGQAWHGNDERHLLLAKRTFFGIHRVYEDVRAGQHTLFHGTTLHGRQAMQPGGRKEPLTYFSRGGPIGQVFANLGQLRGNARVAVIGLGSGTLAAYACEGQEWTFYEIDPAVEQIARDRRLFTFLADSAVRPAVVLGDARLSLARTPAGLYDLIVVDAFSSDAIPVHLITREALDLYLSRLTSRGVVALHISNRHLALGPVVARIADDRGVVALAQWNPVTAADERTGKQASEWMVLAARPQDLEPLTRDPRWTLARADPAVPLWTDDFSNILSVLKTN